jgi:hypothetical protein
LLRLQRIRQVHFVMPITLFRTLSLHKPTAIVHPHLHTR